MPITHRARGFATPIVGGSRLMGRRGRIGRVSGLSRGITINARGGRNIGSHAIRTIEDRVTMTTPPPPPTPGPRITAGIFSIMRRVPSFPNKRNTLVRCLTDGVGCPIMTRRGNMRNHIVISFIMRHSNSVSSIGMTHSISPSLSHRTRHIIGDVPE